MVGKIPWRREQLPTPLFWPGELHGLYSPRGRKESDTTEWLSLHFSVPQHWEFQYPALEFCHDSCRKHTHTHTHTRTCTFHIPLDQVTLPMGTCQKASRSARGPSPHSLLVKPPSPWPAHFSGAVAAENYPGRWAASLNTVHSVSPATFKIPLCQRRRK